MDPGLSNRRPQSVRVGHNTSSTTHMSTGAPQGLCAQPAALHAADPRLHCQFSSNHIIKFADDTTVVGSHQQQRWNALQREVAQLAEWCGTNNLSLNVEKTKEVVMDFRRNSVDHPPLTIESSTMERVSSTKFLGCTSQRISPGPPTPCHSSKKAQQRLHFLRRLKRASLPPPILTTFYRGTIESVLTSCITVWYGNCSACWPQDPPADSEHGCKDHWCPSPIHPGHFPCTMLQQNQQHREGPHPPLPQSLPAPTIRKTVPEHQSPLRQTAQQLFPPGCESPELRSPRPPSETPCKPPTSWNMDHLPPTSPNTPQPYHTKEKTVNFFVQSKCATHRWVGLYKPPVVTHSPLCTRHFS